MVGSRDQLLAEIAPLRKGDALEQINVVLKGNFVCKLLSFSNPIDDLKAMVHFQRNLVKDILAESIAAAYRSDAQFCSSRIEEGWLT